MIYNILDFGAAGDGVTDDTKPIQLAIDSCAVAGGGTVLVPAGQTFLTGTVQLASHVHLHLEGGTRLLSAEDPAAFPNGDLRCMIEARDCEQIAVTGFGTIDGRALSFMAEDLGYIYRPKDPKWRPRLIGLIGCRHVTFRDITLTNAANWCLHMTGCEDVVVHGIRILNDLKVPNCDGIDPDHCRNVRISDCHIEAGDDCIVIKNTADFAHYGPSENIVVSNCTLVSTSAAIKIGTESVSDFRDMVFRGCVIRGSSRGLAIQLRDQGNVENIVFSDMIIETRLFEEHWWGKAEPIYVTAIPRFGENPPPAELPSWNPKGALGRVHNVRFCNILCRGENGVFIAGSECSPITDLVLDGVRVEVGKTSKWPGGKHDRRPCDALGAAFRDPTQDPGLTDYATSGVFLEHASGVILRDVEVAWGANAPDYFGHALEVHHVTCLDRSGFRGQAAHPNIPAVLEDPFSAAALLVVS